MAEKKKSWFGRLFGGKKDDAPAITETPDVTPESVDSDKIETSEEAVSVSSESPATPQEPTTIKEEIVHVAETVVEAVKEEIHESFTREHHEESSDETLDNTNETEAKTLQPQHGFVEEIAHDAKTEVDAAKSASSTLEESTKTSEPEAEIIIENEEEAPTIVVEVPSSTVEIEKAINTEDSIAESATDTIEESVIKAIPEVEETIVDAQVSSEPTISEPIINKPIADEEVIEEVADIEVIADEPVAEEIEKKEITSEEVTTDVATETIETQEKPEKKAGFFARLSSKLSKTRNNLTEGIADLFLGKKEISEEILEELETRLLMADVGIKVTDQMLTSIRDSVSRKSLSNVDELFAALKVQMKDILEPVSKPLVIDSNHKPYVILMIGVNGVGKTTTIGKLAKKFQAEGKSVMLAAGDTFRAAAVEQLEIWGERNKIPVISQKEGADPASVIFDAMESAKARKMDILIADTAGRLHTDSGLMQELAKINRVIKRHDETAPHEVMLVVDASTGQNALNQARQFNTTVPLSGITFTKLDGTAKGGIIFAIAEELNIPIRFIGVGESIDDLRPFNADEFVDALISTEKA
ncbi:signal recognition particle-docking protein FtsY [Ignatzschineria rhizosphaerae]|uniref:Signal recognition particle receptor FtsY n=1 Tax=Ignatzschineria rhizosphaerae TaxID=2923279 RepID=A0ABY3X1F9_9GAMM|nr:signal recognition particle-docking protein FtsY [Ignatzschineria rhizosphaerae]UNM96717.1 signal recognition particle-docking protein FtsY [Ignatzschineria rhizosphaerae]